MGSAFEAYARQLEKLPEKNKTSSELMFINFIIIIISLIIFSAGIFQIITLKGRSLFQLILIIGLIINGVANFISWYAITFEEDIIIDSEKLLNFGFACIFITLPLVITCNTYGIFWSGSYTLYTYGILFFLGLEIVFMILCIIETISYFIMKKNPDNFKLGFKMCPNCHKLIVNQGIYCEHCGKPFKNINDSLKNY